MPGLTPVFHPDAPQTLARFSRRAGLPLTAAQAESLLAHQEQTLLNLGRVDFPAAFCPSWRLHSPVLPMCSRRIGQTRWLS